MIKYPTLPPTERPAGHRAWPLSVTIAGAGGSVPRCWPGVGCRPVAPVVSPACRGGGRARGTRHAALAGSGAADAVLVGALPRR